MLLLTKMVTSLNKTQKHTNLLFFGIAFGYSFKQTLTTF